MIAMESQTLKKNLFYSLLQRGLFIGVKEKEHENRNSKLDVKTLRTILTCTAKIMSDLISFISFLNNCDFI